MTVGERIKDLRKKRGMSADQLAQKIGKDRSTVYRYESDEIEDLPTSVIEPLAKALNTSVSYIMGWDEKFTSPTVTDDYVTFPIIGDVAAGYDQIAIEDWGGETVDIPRSYLKGRSKEDFIVLRVKGDSMYPLYLDGDIVLILKQTTLNNSGDIGAVIYEDEAATLKKIEYVVGEDWMKLIPINPEFKPKTIEGEKLEHCRIIGIPKLLIREID